MKIESLLALATVAFGSPAGSIEHDAHPIERRGYVSQLDYTNLGFYAQHAAAAYCNSDKQKRTLLQCNGNCPAVESRRAVVVASFVGPLTGVGGYVAVDHFRREIVLSVRGSHNIRNFIIDVIFPWQDCPLVAQCRVHAGFASGWDDISAAATAAVAAARRSNPSYGIVATGHSLGGAVVTLAAAYLRRAGYPVDVYTYGSPRVGNEQFANMMTSQGRHWRVTHADDPFPRMPPIFSGFRHVSPEYWLAGGSAKQDQYGIRDVRVCYGIANVECNGATNDLDFESHMHYTRDITGCATLALQWKRSDEDPSDQELRERLLDWTHLDQEYVGNMKYYYAVVEE